MHYMKPLVAEDVEVGRQITNAISTELPVEGSLWLQWPDSDEWRLVFASPLVDAKGPRAAYTTFYRAIRHLNLPHEIPLWKIAVVSPKEPLIKHFRALLRGWSTEHSKRHPNNQFVENAYIYHL